MKASENKLNLRIERLEKTLRLVIGELAHDEVLSLEFFDKLQKSTLTDSAINQEAEKREASAYWSEEAVRMQLRNMVP